MREGCDRSLRCHAGAPGPLPALPAHGTALADIRRVTVTTTKIERTGPSIRAALAEFAPAECEQFEAEFQPALGQAAELFDLAPSTRSWTAGGASRPFAPIRSTSQSTSWWRTPKPAATPDGWPATRTAAGRSGRGRCPVTPRYGSRLPSSSTTLSRSRFGGWSTPGSRSCWSGRKGLGRRLTRAPTPRSAPTVAAPVSSCPRWLVRAHQRVLILRLG